MVPEFQTPVFESDVWGVESLLTHLTESPTFMLIGFGEYAVVVSANEPGTMLAVVVAPDVVAGVAAGVELGAVVEPELLLLHAAAARRAPTTST
jgi:hypothetical protein